MPPLSSSIGLVYLLFLSPSIVQQYFLSIVFLTSLIMHMHDVLSIDLLYMFC